MNLSPRKLPRAVCLMGALLLPVSAIACGAQESQTAKSVPEGESRSGGDSRRPARAASGDPSCDMKTCSGSATSELETSLAFRAKQAHQCYDQALTRDSTLQGKITINVHLAANGDVCSADVVANELSTPSVAQCVADYFRSTGHFPAPQGGCIDVELPFFFMRGSR